VATCDPAQIGEWWPLTPAPAPAPGAPFSSPLDVCIDVGACHWVILDIDNPERLLPWVREALVASKPPFQSTRSDVTERGHAVFRQPEGRRLSNNTRKPGGVDVMNGAGQIRGHGGIVRTLGLHEKGAAGGGGRYKWVRWGAVPVLPESIADQLPDCGEPSAAASGEQVDAFCAAHSTGDPDHHLIEFWCTMFCDAAAAGRHTAVMSVLGRMLRQLHYGKAEYPADVALEASFSASADLGAKLGLEASGSAARGTEGRDLRRETRQGTERISLNFSEIAKALRELAASLSARRVWLILDEWSSVPTDIQPYLGAFLVRCVLPVRAFTVKIAAIEQQTRFRETRADGSIIGLELGADIAANVDLDEFMVFEQNEHRARSFFRGLLFKHLSAGVESAERVPNLATEQDVIRLGFTDVRAFDELVRAADGVPRDAINIAAKAALRASDRRISVPDVRAAARTWFQADKEAALRSREDALGGSWSIERHRRRRC
jgi:hypothetical protein